MIRRVEEHDRAPDPIDVRPFRPTLLLVITRAHGAETMIGQRLEHVGVTQQHGGPHLGHPGSSRTGVDQRGQRAMRAAEVRVAEVELR